MKHLSGLLVVTAALVSLWATVAVAQTPSPTATQTSVVPTATPTATPTPSTPPFNGAVPVIVDLNGVLDVYPGPTQGVRQEVSWKGVADSSANYELERSATDSTTTRDFQRLATIPGIAPGADGLFTYRDPLMSHALETCYRVRAVSASVVSAYSPERCQTLDLPPGGVPHSGPGVAPSAPSTGSGVANESANTALPRVAGVVLLSIAAALLITPKLHHRGR